MQMSIKGARGKSSVRDARGVRDTRDMRQVQWAQGRYETGKGVQGGYKVGNSAENAAGNLAVNSAGNLAGNAVGNLTRNSVGNLAEKYSFLKKIQFLANFHI